MKSVFAILGLPVNVSGQGADVDRLLVGVHILMALLFIGWFTYYVSTLRRFSASRHPTADYKGATTHASTWIEGIVALIEAGLLIGLALPVWSRTVDHFPEQKDATVIKLVGQQFLWNAWYPGTNGTFVKADSKLVAPDNPFGFDKTDAAFKYNFVQPKDFLVPINKPVIAYISSLDVIHSFACRPLRAMQDAIPGMAIPVHFTPVKEGTYVINCAQLCGAGHYSMRGSVKVVSQADFDKWIAGKIKAVAGVAPGYE